MTHLRRLATTAAALLLVLSAGAGGLTGAGCGGGAPPPPPGGIFVAFGKDFVGFRDWPSHSYDNPDASALPDAAATHLAGLRTVFINQLPPAGATAFPVGTIIVKEVAANGKIFARAKRGGGYNRTGARDWEWFEIKEANGDQVAVVWHGVGPPIGEEYAGDPNGGCNGCHKAATANDFVLSPWPVLEPGEAGGDGGEADGDDGSTTASDGGVDDGGEAGDGGIPADAAVD